MHCYITRVAGDAKLTAEQLAEFEASLKETEPMRPDVESIPLRLIL